MSCVLGRGCFHKYMLDWGVEKKQIWPSNRYKAVQTGLFIILIRKNKAYTVINYSISIG